MDKKIEVTETTVIVDESWKDKFVLATLGLIVGVAVETFVQKGYFTMKARYQTYRSNKTTK